MLTLALKDAGQKSASFHSLGHQVGRNPDVDAAEDIWSGGGDFAEDTVESVVDIISTNIVDDDTGTGAQSVDVIGVNAAGEIVQERILTNGGGTATGTVPMKWVNSAEVGTAGTGETNAAAITIQNAANTVTWGVIPAGAGKMQNTVYKVPTGYLLAVHKVWAELNFGSPAGTSADLELLVKENGVWRFHKTLSVSSGTPWADRHFEIPLVFNAGALLKIRCTAVQAIDTDISAGFEYSQWLNSVV